MTETLTTDPLTTLTQAGVAIWLDDLSRDRLTQAAWLTWSPTTTWSG